MNRHMLSTEFYRRIAWIEPDGVLEDMMARVAMLVMHRDGLILLVGAAGSAKPAPTIRLRAGHRTAAVPVPDHPQRGPSARPSPGRTEALGVAQRIPTQNEAPHVEVADQRCTRIHELRRACSGIGPQAFHDFKQLFSSLDNLVLVPFFFFCDLAIHNQQRVIL